MVIVLCGKSRNIFDSLVYTSTTNTHTYTQYTRTQWNVSGELNDVISIQHLFDVCFSVLLLLLPIQVAVCCYFVYVDDAELLICWTEASSTFQNSSTIFSLKQKCVELECKNWTTICGCALFIFSTARILFEPFQLILFLWRNQVMNGFSTVFNNLKPILTIFYTFPSSLNSFKSWTKRI